MNEIRKFPLEHKLVFFYFFVVSCSFLFSKITNLSGATSFTSSVIFISMVYVVYNFFTQGKDFFIFKWRYLLYTCLQVTPALAILLIYSYPDVISLDLSTFGSSNFDFAINVFDIAFLENHSVADSQINSHNKILPFSVEPHNGRFAVFVFGSFLSGLGIHPLIAGKICLYLSLVFLTFVNAGIIRTCFQSNNIFLCHFLSALVVVSSAVLNQSMFYMILGATISLAIFYLGLWYSFVFVFFDEKREIKTQFGLLCGISFCLYFAYQPFFLLFLAWLAGILIIRSWLKSRIRVTTFKVFSILIGVALFYSVSSYWLFVTFNRDDFSIFSEYGMGYGPLFALGILSYPLSLSLVGGEFFFEGINLVELWSIVVFSLAFILAFYLFFKKKTEELVFQFSLLIFMYLGVGFLFCWLFPLTYVAFKISSYLGPLIYFFICFSLIFILFNKNGKINVSRITNRLFIVFGVCVVGLNIYGSHFFYFSKSFLDFEGVNGEIPQLLTEADIDGSFLGFSTAIENGYVMHLTERFDKPVVGVDISILSNARVPVEKMCMLDGLPTPSGIGKLVSGKFDGSGLASNIVSAPLSDLIFGIARYGLYPPEFPSIEAQRIHGFPPAIRWGSDAVEIVIFADTLGSVTLDVGWGRGFDSRDDRLRLTAVDQNRRILGVSPWASQHTVNNVSFDFVIKEGWNCVVLKHDSQMKSSSRRGGIINSDLRFDTRSLGFYISELRLSRDD